MKDAKGHGSDPRAGHRLAADYRAAHNVPYRAVPTVRQAVHAFMKDTGGSGKPFLHEIPDDTEKYQNVLETYGHLLSHGKHPHVEPSHLMHLAHFVHTLAAIAFATVLVQAIAWVFGVHLV